ncbi:hypothetical protein DFH09DRAFT_1126923 [Mycena vulgaris]|nr:hypothetical protein DFH09DRAFT_1126923 [Mycena vulgaris]
MSGTSRASAEFTPNSSLPRGQACAYCRRRKMRCDGQRPVCGPCSRALRPDDCEYTENHSRSRADVLEEDISRLESRIYELEHPAEAAGVSVFLHRPYQQPQRLAQMPSVLQVLGAPSPAPPPSVANTWWDSPEPPINMVETFIDAFLPYASDWGFFLDPARFRHDALLPHPIGHHSRPSPPLLTAVYLIGIALSDSTAWRTHGKIFLSRALSALPISLSGLHPRKGVHALQAEILLSNYFYASGRFLEGQYHTTAAASLTVSNILLKTGAAVASLWPITVESLDACWSGIILDKSWAVALAMNPNLNCEMILDLPWPEDGTTEPLALPSSRSYVSQFLEGTELSSAAGSAKTLLAKAVTLWERANNLVGWKPDLSPQESEEFSNGFKTLDLRIHEFHSNFECTAPAPNPRALVVAHSIAYAAVIQLHGTFAQTDPRSKQKCLAAAKSILTLVAGADLRGSAFINPVVSAMWVAACDVAIDEIAGLRAMRPTWAPDVPTADEAALARLFDSAVEGMRQFEAWPLMKYHIAKIEQAYNAV